MTATERQVRTCGFVDEDLVEQRLLGVDHRRERFVVDVDQLGCVDRRGVALGDYRHERFAHVPHRVTRQERPHHRGVHRRRRGKRREIEILGGDHVEHARCGRRSRRVEARDTTLGDRGAHVHHVRDFGQVEVRDELPAAGEQRQILDAPHRRAEQQTVPNHFAHRSPFDHSPAHSPSHPERSGGHRRLNRPTSHPERQPPSSIIP
ncbi:unannotated protein [freshwater metagenome]|uniref:Unannotated protein n=1 Tax=freshwater metagenome TaxID=449393 RepID=A0A6J7QH33_9ZZZZ